MTKRHFAALRQEDIRETGRGRSRVRAIPLSVRRRNLNLLATLALASALLFALGWNTARAMEIQKVISAKGIEAWLVEDHTVPIIAMNFAFTGGTTQDDPGKEGSVAMLSSLLDEGAADMDSQTFQMALEENAIKLSFDMGQDRFYGSLRSLTPNSKTAFDLLAKALQAPHFDDEPIERMRAQWIASAKRSVTQPSAMLATAYRQASFGDHPYSKEPNGTVASLGAITKDDIKRLYSNIVTRDGLTIGVVGAIDAETLKQVLDEVFAPLPEAGELKAIEDMKITRAGDIHVPFISPQTIIRFGAPGIDRHDKDFYAAYMVNHILGGGTFSSRLYNEIREKRGLAYNVSSYLSSLDHVDFMSGGMATRSGNEEQALMLLKQEIQKLGNEGPTQEELDSAKKYLIGSFPLRFDTSSKIAAQLVAIQVQDLGIDYFDKRNSYIEAVTLEDAKRVAKRLLDTSKLLIVTVGQQIKHAALAPDKTKANTEGAQESAN
ncbi:pitrilysin family protein [uncultured Cohaesibacter sp.]|uniref:M16 family metallopeptidase n=1 Tax=uncultured Cohaesibacter sp. TaxID=1002546 RepID=UPI002931CB18|nr:pitrilysin family protein [uncultured Cohaesibacter sp.]